MKKVIRLNESDIEKLVQKIIREEGEKPKEKETTLTKHPAYSVIDALGKKLEDLKTEFKDGIANAVSGSDGYHSEIDKFSSDFTKFIGKLEDLKTKVNDYQVVDNKRHQEEKAKQMQERKRMMYMAQDSYEKTR
jgi:molecular chaperone DnaK (HSP70)